MSKEIIIAFIGRAGSGKDYQCQLLEKHGYTKVAFADALRDIAFTALGLIPDSSQEPDYYLKHYNSYKQGECIRVWDHNGDKDTFNMRVFIERLATEGIRKYDPDFWARCVINKIIEQDLHKICISDLRFANEYRVLANFSIQYGYYLLVGVCDYHSDRYIENETHESARLANYLIMQGYMDGQFIDRMQMLKILNQYEESINEHN